VFLFNIPSNSSFNQETAHKAFDNLTTIISEKHFDPNSLAAVTKYIMTDKDDCLTKVLVDLGSSVFENTDEAEFDDFSALVVLNNSLLITMMENRSEDLAPFGWQISQVEVSLYSHHQFAGMVWNPATKRKDTPKYGLGQYQLVIRLKPCVSTEDIAPCCNNKSGEGKPLIVSSTCSAFSSTPSAQRRSRHNCREMDENGGAVEEPAIPKTLPVIPSKPHCVDFNLPLAKEIVDYLTDFTFSENNFATNILWVVDGTECVTTLNASLDHLVRKKVTDTLRAHKLECCLSTTQNEHGKFLVSPQEMNLVKDLIAAYSTQYLTVIPLAIKMLTERAPTLLRRLGWSLRTEIKLAIFDEKQFRGFNYSVASGEREALYGASGFKISIPLAPLTTEIWARSGPICCNREKGYDSPRIMKDEIVTEHTAPAPGTAPYRDRALVGASLPPESVSTVENLRDSRGQRYVPLSPSARRTTAPVEEDRHVRRERPSPPTGGGRSYAGGGGRPSPREDNHRSHAGGRSYAGGGGRTASSEDEDNDHPHTGGGGRSYAGSGGRSYAGGGRATSSEDNHRPHAGGGGRSYAGGGVTGRR